MTNNPRKAEGVESWHPGGGRIALQEGRNPPRVYLSTKANKLDHLFKK